MGYEINPPVHRVIFVGTREDTMRHAAALYQVCRKRRQVPAFFESRTMAGVNQQLQRITMPTCVIAFGPSSQEVYDMVRRNHPAVKMLRLLDSGAPEPEFSFSYLHQILPLPQAEKDYERIASWMGLHERCAEEDRFTEDLHGGGSISTELLE